MTIYIGPVSTHSATDFHPPGVVGDDWCHMVSDTSLPALQDFLTANLATIGAQIADVRTPSTGSTVTYIALSAAQRAAAISAGAGATPSDGKAYAKAFDVVPGATWEP